MINSNGPRIEPCGTPQVTGSKLDAFALTLQCCTLFDKYDFNRDKSLSCRPYRHSFSSNISRFTVSKAFLKSRNITAFAFPLSMFNSQLTCAMHVWWNEVIEIPIVCQLTFDCHQNNYIVAGRVAFQIFWQTDKTEISL